MYVSHTIDLLETFQPNDAIFIRFRLHSDPLAVAWGWAIDNIQIQPEAVPTEQLPDQIALTELQGNYPNPFQGATTIPFTIAEESQVTLSVFDVEGRKITDLIQNKAYAAGEHTMAYQADHLASGVYFYRLIAKPAQSTVQVQQTRSMILKR